MTAPLLALRDVRAGYGSAVVLDGITFELPERGGLAVLGRNGVGKSTLLLTIMGYTQIARGRVWSGADALKVGLVDEMGGFTKAVDYVKTKIGLKPDDTVTLALAFYCPQP